MQSRNMIWQSVLFALLGVTLCYVSFDKIDFKALLEVFKTGNYSVAIPVFFVSLIVYVSRVKRWQILYKAAGYNAPANFLLASLASGYLVNFAVPRLGEVSRALILKRWLNYPVPMSLSTIVFERISDVICLCLIIVMAFVLEIINEGHLLQEFSAGVPFLSLNKTLLLLVLAVVSVLIYYFIKSRNNILGAWFNQFTEAFKKLIKMKNRTWFLIHTGVIWLGFFFMTYLWIFLFKESSSLTIYQAYLIMVLGVIARTLPIQAGSAGAYHFIVSKVIILLGIGNLVASAIAIVIHGFQTVFTLLFGAISYLWLISQKRVNPDDAIINAKEYFNNKNN